MHRRPLTKFALVGLARLPACKKNCREAVERTQYYLYRIAKLDSLIHAVIEINPESLNIAADATTSDALATAMVVLGKEKGSEIAKQIPGITLRWSE